MDVDSWIKCHLYYASQLSVNSATTTLSIMKYKDFLYLNKVLWTSPILLFWMDKYPKSSEGFDRELGYEFTTESLKQLKWQINKCQLLNW